MIFSDIIEGLFFGNVLEKMKTVWDKSNINLFAYCSNLIDGRWQVSDLRLKQKLLFSDFIQSHTLSDTDQEFLILEKRFNDQRYCINVQTVQKLGFVLNLFLIISPFHNPTVYFNWLLFCLKFRIIIDPLCTTKY